MKVIYGKVRDLKFIDAIVGQYPKLQQEASTMALISLFSESGGMGAAASLAGVTGFPGYYIHFCIDDMEFYAAFTGVFFQEGETIYVVYDENVENNFNVLAIMNKNNHLLGMVVPFGHTVEMSDKAHDKTALTMGWVMAIVGCSIMAYYSSSVSDILENIYIYIYNTIFIYFTFMACAWH